MTIKNMFKLFFCKHEYVWIDGWVDENIPEIIIDEYECQKCGFVKKRITLNENMLTNNDI